MGLKRARNVRLPVALLLAAIAPAAAPVATSDAGGKVTGAGKSAATAPAGHEPRGKAIGVERAATAQAPATRAPTAPTRAAPSLIPQAEDIVRRTIAETEGARRAAEKRLAKTVEKTDAEMRESVSRLTNPDSGADAGPATPAAPPTSAPAPAAAPQTQTIGTQTSTRTRGGRSRTPESAARSRRARTRRAAGEARRTRAAAPAVDSPARSRSTPSRARRFVRPDAPASGSPLARTVVRVLEVIPRRLRIALAVLAGLGLLLAAATVAQTIRARRLERQRRRLAMDVGVLQSALLPELPRTIGGARVTAAYRPAAGLAAGGDFYDAFELPGGRTGLLVGDIAGHGREVVPLTALVRYSLRAYLEGGLAPRAALHVMANVLGPQLGSQLVTVAVAIFDSETGRLTYACAGHWPPLLVGMDDHPVTAGSSLPIGAGIPTGRRQTTLGLPAGAAACFYTDGLADVRLGAGRLGSDGVAQELAALGAEGHAEELLARVVRLSDSQPDDMAVCMVTAPPAREKRWSVRIEELEVDAAMLRSGVLERFLVACDTGIPHIERALVQASEIISWAGTAVVEVRGGEELAEVRVNLPPAISLPVARDVPVPVTMTGSG